MHSYCCTPTHQYYIPSHYSIEESRLNYKMLPKKMLATKNENVTRTKLAKNRLTMVTCNASGNHKMPLFVIGKSEKPRAFIHVNCLPITDIKNEIGLTLLCLKCGFLKSVAKIK